MSESTEQQHLVYWFRAQYPDKIIYANPNSTWLPMQNTKYKMAYLAKRKREGLLAGVSDLLIPEPIYSKLDTSFCEAHGLYLELKDVGKTEKDVTDNQQWFLEEMRKRGYAAHWAAGFDHGQAIITEYMKGAM